MLVPLLLVLASASSEAPVQRPTLAVGPPDAMVLVVNRPTADQTKLGASAIASTLEDLLATNSALALTRLEAERVADCEGLAPCMVKRLTTRPKPAYLLLLTAFTTKRRPDRVSVLLIDVGATEQCAPDTDCAEAVRVETPFIELADADAWRQWLNRLVTVEVRTALERTGHFGASGAIDLSADVDGVSVQLDGHDVGVLPGRVGRVVGVRPGPHDVRLVHESYGEQRQTVGVDSGATAQVDFVLAQHGTARAITTFGGWGLAGVGLALTIATLLQPSVNVVCTDTPCDGAGLRTLSSVLGGGPESGDRDPNTGSILALPLGYSLIAAGATMSITTKLIGDVRDPPWLQVLLGVGVGVLTYAVSAFVHSAVR